LLIEGYEAWKNPEKNMGDVLWKNKNNGENAWKICGRPTEDAWADSCSRLARIQGFALIHQLSIRSALATSRMYTRQSWSTKQG
jgi:hypothetical protein